MNRRKAIKRILLLGTGTALSYGGFRIYKTFRSPDLNKLDKYQPLIDDLAEVIIPATDTPGARQAGVGQFISKMVREASKTQTQNKFIDGLEAVDDYSNKNFGKPFGSCSDNEKVHILKHFESSGLTSKGIAGKVEKKLFGESFFVTLKKYTIIGYCTSREGATKALAYDFVPGSYRGIVKIKPGQKSWALQ